MEKLRDFPIMNFDGGLVCNKSDYEMDRNEMKTLINFDIDEKGKLKRRRGIQQWADTITGKTFDSYWYTVTAGGTTNVYQIVVARQSNPVIYKISYDYLTAAITTASTSIPCRANPFAGSGNICIEGDVIAYTGASSLNLTGASGIVTGHPAYSAITQLRAVDSSTVVDTRLGTYFTIINGLLFINGKGGSGTFDGTNFTAVSDADEPAGIFATNYRDRVYVAGDGTVDGSGTRNGAPNRVSYSDAGDATSWDISNYFDVEDDLGEMISALRANDDNLFIFKPNSIFTYNEVQLKQQLWKVGAYNHFCIQKFGANFITFGPSGVHITNGFSSKKISKPIEKYLKKFQPNYDATGDYGRVINNCFSGQFENKYYLYIGDILNPDDGSQMTDVVLVYDTEKNNWTIHDGYTDIAVFTSFSGWGTGLTYISGNVTTPNYIEGLFASDASGRYYRLFENSFYDTETARVVRGGDVIANMISDNTGSTISCIAETPFYDLGNPSWWKYFGKLRVLVEKGDFTISYRLDKGTHYTDWISLGTFNEPNRLVGLPDQTGYRISFKITSNTKDVLSTLNGLIIEEINAEQKK